MPTIKAEFDGQVFKPCSPVSVPPGTLVDVVISVPPPPLTEEEMRQWEEIVRQIDASPPHFATLDDAMRYLRKRP